MRIKIFSCTFIGVFIVFLLHTFLYPVLFEKGIGNIPYFSLMVISFFSSFFLTYLLIKRIDFDWLKNINVLFLVCSIFFLVWFAFMYFYEPYTPFFSLKFSFRHRISASLYFPILLFSSLGVLFIIRKSGHSLNKIRYAFGAVIALIQCAVLFAPNYLNDDGGTLCHIHAYFNPIYNAADFRPLNDVIRSIYGHYSFFYIIPMNILLMFGISKVYSAMMITAFLGLLSFLLLYFAINKLIDNDAIYILTVFALAYISFYYYQLGQYYQLLPHRILFLCVSVFIFSLFQNKKIPLVLVVIASSLSILWNFETGLICAISFNCFYFFKELSGKERRVTKLIGKACLSVLISMFSCFVGLNLLNLCLGGSFVSFLDFIFPIGSNEYKISDLAVKIPGVGTLYFLEFFVFTSIICIVLLKFFLKQCVDSYSTLFSAATFGIGLSTYYINRAAYSNISISHIPFVVCLAILLQLLINRGKEYSIKKHIGYFSILFCVSIFYAFFLLGTITGIPLTIKNRLQSSWNLNNYHNILNVFKYEIPANTPAVGVGLPDIYSSLGWDPQIYIMDWVDWLNCESVVNYALDEIDMQDTLLIDKVSTIEDYMDFSSWIAVKQIDNQFTYLIKVDSSFENKKEALLFYAFNNQYSFSEFLDLCFLNYFHVFPSNKVKNDLYNIIPEDTDWGDIIDLFESGAIVPIREGEE